MKYVLFSLLFVGVVAQAYEPSFTCSVTQQTGGGKNPVFNKVVDDFTVRGAEAGKFFPVNQELNVYCQATVPLQGDAGNIQCDFYRGPGIFEFDLAHAYARAVPAGSGFPGSLLLTVNLYNEQLAADNGKFSVTCNQN